MTPTSTMRRRTAGLAALIGVLALLAQALLPAAALAATAAGARQVELCSTEGDRIVVLDRHGAPVKPFAGLPCLDCVGAVTAAVAPPVPAHGARRLRRRRRLRCPRAGTALPDHSRAAAPAQPRPAAPHALTIRRARPLRRAPSPLRA